MSIASERVVIIGGGLAGLTAACELLERGCNVTILEKTANLGGNSSKATCGIAAPGSALQAAASIQDAASDLVADGPAAKALIQTGTKDFEWLSALLGVDDELVLRLTPGHGQVARIVGSKTHFPGAVVSYALIHVLQEVATKKPERLEIITAAKVQKLVTAGAKVTGAEYMKGGKLEARTGPVVVATGGFLGDNSSTSILAESNPSLLKFPTTNDERANGDGIRLAKAIGAGLDKMKSVQVFPTAAVLPGQADAQFKVVISDAICGAGGKLLNGDGARFCNELDSAQTRTDAMLKAKPPFRLVIGEQEAAAVQWLCDFYTQRGVMKRLDGAAALAAELRQPSATAAALQQIVGPAGLYVATVTPALYSCGGGLTTGWEQAAAGKVLNTGGQPIEGLFAAGEVTAAPYQKLWAVSGIPLLHCIYSGRMAGRAAALALLGKEAPVQDLRTLIISSMTSPQKTLAAQAAAAGPPAAKKAEDMSKEELLARVKELEAGGAVAAAPVAAADAGGISWDEVKKHSKKDDAWIVLFGEVYDVTKWIPIHPGGEQAIVAYLGQDATEEWTMIHKPGTIEKNMQHLTKKGKVGGGAAAPSAAAGGAPAAASGITFDEIAKHNKKDDAWIVLFGDVIDVTKWIPIHPGGEQAIVAYLGMDATEEWVMIHKPGTVEKNMQHLNVIGKAAGAPTGGAKAPGAAADDSQPPPEGDGGIPGLLGAVVFLLYNVILTVSKTVFFTGNLKISLDNNRMGTIRSAVFLLTFTIIHALGNFVDMLGGPNELNGEGYLFDRIHWTGGLGIIKKAPFSIVEEYLALCLLVHVVVALKRSYDISINYCLYTGRWNMLISGLTVLFFLTRHLQDFRFFEGYTYVPLYPPKHLIAFDGLLEGRVFYEKPDSGVEPVSVRDIYSHEVELFKDPVTVLIYTACVGVFVVHLCLGWKKLVPADAMQIPRDHQNKVIWLGWIMAFAVAGMYLSVPWYVFLKL